MSLDTKWTQKYPICELQLFLVLPQELLQSCGTDRKGKVEAGVGHAQKTPLKGLRFESLEEAQAYLDRWEERWADTRIHGTTQRQVAAMFAEEKPSLLPLPLEPFRYYQYGERVVHLDGLCRSRSRLLWRPTGLDRTHGTGAMGRVVRPPARS
jgi:hypothetical protein